MRVRPVLLVLALLVTAPGTFAADANGQFMMGGGVGGLTCPEFSSVMTKARSAGIGSLGYVNRTQGFTMYLLGFETAYDLEAGDTCDIFGNFTTDQLLAWIDNYCEAHPLEKFDSAVVALAREVEPKRVKTCH